MEALFLISVGLFLVAVFTLVISKDTGASPKQALINTIIVAAYVPVGACLIVFICSWLLSGVAL